MAIGSSADSVTGGGKKSVPLELADPVRVWFVASKISPAARGGRFLTTATRTAA